MTIKKDKKITVLLADDHPLLRAGFSMTLKNDENIEVVGEAGSAIEACKLYSELSPDVVVMDILFADDMTGLDAIKQILKCQPQANIVVLTQHDQESIIRESYQVGAKGFITKDSDTDQLFEAIYAVAEGKVFFLPEIANRLAMMTARGEKGVLEELTEREREVFRLIALGLTNTEIVERLSVSPKTVSNASHSLKEKLGTNRVADIARMAIRLGVVRANEDS